VPPFPDSGCLRYWRGQEDPRAKSFCFGVGPKVKQKSCRLVTSVVMMRGSPVDARAIVNVSEVTAALRIVL
jgi:hypothetical protein